MQLPRQLLRDIIVNKAEVALDVIVQDQDTVCYQLVFIHHNELWCAYYDSAYTAETTEEAFSRGDDQVDCYRVKPVAVIEYRHID